MCIRDSYQADSESQLYDTLDWLRPVSYTHLDVYKRQPEKFGISFNFSPLNQAGALVHVYKDGSVLINHGGCEMGQGLHTKMIQVAATALGVPVAAVRLAPTRTDKVPNTSCLLYTSRCV